MMKKIGTIDRLARRFALTTAVIIFIFGIIINAFFWFARTRNENRRFAPVPQEQRRPATLINRIQELPLQHPSVRNIPKRNVGFGTLIRIESQRFFIRQLPGDRIALLNVTNQVERQILLGWITIFAIFLFTGGSYVIARIQARKSLQDIISLADYVSHIHIDNLHKSSLSFPYLPANDPVQLVAQKINKMTQKLQKQVNAMKQFISHVSHEFHTPLMAMRAQNEVALQSKKYAETIQKNIDYIDDLHKLIDTLLQLSRVQAGYPLVKKQTDIIPIIKNTIGRMKDIYQNKNIHFTVTLPDTYHLITHSDSRERIVFNLIDNACKYTVPAGYVIITLTTDYFTVSNTGKYISPHEIEQIRQPFWQGDNTKTTKGFGIGLSLIKALIDVLGYEITVKSTKTNTTFTIRFSSGHVS